jgi:hypothetical protein
MVYQSTVDGVSLNGIFFGKAMCKGKSLLCHPFFLLLVQIGEITMQDHDYFLSIKLHSSINQSSWS